MIKKDDNKDKKTTTTPITTYHIHKSDSADENIATCRSTSTGVSISPINGCDAINNNGNNANNGSRDKANNKGTSSMDDGDDNEQRL